MTEWCAAAPAAAHVLIDGALDDDLVVTGRDGHHLQRVRRLRVGECVTVADGRGCWRTYLVAASDRGDLGLQADGPQREEPVLTPALTVAFALTKGEKPESVVMRLTELGVDRVVPVLAQRSVVRWHGSRVDAALDRLARVAREAAMQCRRARLPEIARPVQLVELAGQAGLVVADRGGQTTDVPPPGAGGWLLLIGPEGGLDPAELAALGEAPRVRVGPHVLRAETAAVAAAAVLTVRRHPATRHGG